MPAEKLDGGAYDTSDDAVDTAVAETPDLDQVAEDPLAHATSAQLPKTEEPEPEKEPEPEPEPESEPESEGDGGQFDTSIAARENFSKLRDSFTEKESQLLERIKTLESAPPQEAAPDKESIAALETKTKEMEALQARYNEVASQYQTIDERLRIFDLENHPGFKDKYDFSQIIDETKELVSGLGVTSATVDTLFKLKGGERVKKLAEVMDGIHTSSGQAYMMQVAGSLAEADRIESERTKALADASATRGQLEEASQHQATRIQADAIEQNAIVARQQFDGAIHTVAAETGWWQTADGQVAESQVRKNFAEQRYNAGDFVRMALRNEMVDPLTQTLQHFIQKCAQYESMLGQDPRPGGPGPQTGSTDVEEGGGLYDPSKVTT